ncbi:tripartite ATP-independent transporter solute receptor, DctP family [Anaerovirgula multivorans]|uniref:Tripartite ATP-independent transporter solute receptor, DctP family n=1 Tax=Anaerovirgula multivorans TaxID=312168 RepID=A0A239JMS3_9FIRM|nr:TRAP transporter substrate-binding protein [Anaerovirgula multivorans]SNT06064.1 tripartite ATP-independent transporter solute receptor, DctP family [Anaerovirgula multivorans]
MKKNFCKLIAFLVLVLLTTSVLSGCASNTPVDSVDSSDDSKVYEFKFGHAADENNTWHKGAMKFAEEVEKRSEGRIKVTVYPSEMLGNEIDNVTAIQAGTADMVLSGESLQNWANKVGIMSTPYLIKDSEHLKAVIQSEAGEIIENEIYEKAGLKVLTYFERGPRMLSSNKPINNINDLNGLRLRLPNVPLFVETWNHWGARPTPMAFSEVFTGLQQNTIEAQENPLALMHSGGFYEVQKYINNTAHVRGWIYMLIGVDQWEALPDDLKQVMEEAAQVAQEYEHQLFLEGEEEIFNSLINEKGMEFIETDTSEMISSAEEYYQENLDAELLELYNLIKNVK